MTASMTITLDDGGLGVALDAVAAFGGDLTPAMDDIGQSLVVATQQRFEQGISPDGAAWKPSIRATAEGGLTLVERGHLRDSITHRAGKDSVEVGTNVFYAAVHQFGATISAKSAKSLKFQIGDRYVQKKSVTIPARPFIGLSMDDRTEITAILSDHLRKAFA